MNDEEKMLEYYEYYGYLEYERKKEEQAEKKEKKEEVTQTTISQDLFRRCFLAPNEYQHQRWFFLIPLAILVKEEYLVPQEC